MPLSQGWYTFRARYWYIFTCLSTAASSLFAGGTGEPSFGGVSGVCPTTADGRGILCAANLLSAPDPLVSRALRHHKAPRLPSQGCGDRSNGES